MPLFEYSGFDSGGKKVSGVLEGAGRRAVLQKLRSQGIYPTVLNEETEASPRRLSLGFGAGRRVSAVELAAGTRQLATLLGAGLPLDEALETVAGQVENQRLGRAWSRVREEVVQGEALYASLEKQHKIFPELFINMVQVGENSGTLDQVLQRLADFLEDQARMKSRIRSALAYPLLMTVIGVGVVIFLFAFVVPKVTRMLQDLGQALPLPTLLLIRLSHFLAAWWWLLLILAILAGIALYRWRQTDRGRMVLDRFLLRAPIFGKLNLLVITSRFTRTLATLLRSGVPLLKALNIARNLVQNRPLRKALEETEACAREGEGLAAPMRRTGAFPPMVVQMTAVGERSGNLEEMLLRVSEAYEHQVDMTLNSLLSLLEPLLILVMGSVVGFVVLAVLLPIFQASQGMG